MRALTELEVEYGFHFPQLYRDLFEENRMGTASAGSLGAPCFLSFVTGLSLFTLKQIRNELQLQSLKSKNMGTLNSLKYIPFAQDISGAVYCFCFDQNNPEADAPIRRFCYSYLNTELIAKNLEDFLFRAFLEVVEDIQLAGVSDEVQNNSALRQSLEYHRLFLNTRRFAIIEKIFNRPTFYYQCHETRQARGKLSTVELFEYLNAEIGLEELGTSYNSIQNTHRAYLEMLKG